MSSQARGETVIVVHGTFAGPGAEGAPSWWERGGDFCNRLDQKLTEYGSAARCWADGGECFRWSGENSWAARTKAASELRAYIHRLIQLGWTCHVVAHSHGGTVLLEALRDALPRPATSGIGWLCTLGTPYFTLKARPFWPFTAWARPYVCVALGAAWVFALVAFGVFSTHPWTAWGLVATLVLWVLAGLLAWLVGEMPSIGPRYDLTDTPLGSERLLTIGCHEDEAFRFLDELKKLENPLPPIPSKPLLVLGESLRTARALDAVRFSTESPGFLWLVPAAFVHIVVIPIRIVLFVASFVSLAIVALGRPMARAPAWTVVQTQLFGLGGSPVGIDRVDLSRHPAEETNVPFVYEELEPAIVARAEQRRSDSTGSAGAQISDALEALSGGGDVLAPLRRVLLDVDLIHSSYYQDDLAIERVIVWLSMPEEERLLRAAKVHDDNNLEFSLEKRVPEQNRKAHLALMDWRATLGESDREHFDKRSLFIHRYRGCCHASETWGNVF